MQAIAATGKVDENGVLHLDQPLQLKDSEVKVLILVPESELSEEAWLGSIAANPVFGFLADEEEDLYSLDDGQAFEVT